MFTTTIKTPTIRSTRLQVESLPAYTFILWLTTPIYWHPHAFEAYSRMRGVRSPCLSKKVSTTCVI
jgi:hypothetical protein